MPRLLFAFAVWEGSAVAAFLWAPLSAEGRAPGDLLGWALGAAGCFYLLAWPILEARREGDPGLSPGKDAAGVAACGAMLLLAAAPFISAAVSLAPVSAGIFLRAAVPAMVAWIAGGLLAWSSRVGGAMIGRAAAVAALAGLAAGPVIRLLAGVSGPFPPGEAVTLFSHPWLVILAAAFPAAALAARRLRTGEAAE